MNPALGESILDFAPSSSAPVWAASRSLTETELILQVPGLRNNCDQWQLS